MYVKLPGAHHRLGKKAALRKYGLMLRHVLVSQCLSSRNPRFNIGKRRSPDEHVNNGLGAKTWDGSASNVFDSE